MPYEKKENRNERNPRYYQNRDNRERFQNKEKSMISVVIPAYNEEESIPELMLQLEDVLDKIAKDRYEIIIIDDGSTDKTFETVKLAKQRNSKIRGIRFRRNFGKSAALAVGFKEARGVVIITMDADLQDDPKELPRMIQKLKEGYDLVSGWKKVRHDPISKTLPSKLFNRVTSIASGIRLHDFNCGLKAYRREAAKSLQVYGEMHRYLPALSHLMGFRVTEIPVEHHERKYGKTKFGMSRFFNGFLDLATVIFTTKYVKRPMHIFGLIGTLCALVGFGIDLWLSIEWALGKTALSNRPLSLLGVLMIIVGVQLFSMGLIAELIVKNSDQSRLQFYSIKEKI